MNYKDLSPEELMCYTGRRMREAGMVTANDGNLSLRLDDGNILCTPTGIPKDLMTADMLCVISPEGEVLQNGSFSRPSSEVKMHLSVYRNLPDTKAVVHAHPVYATTFAAAGEDLKDHILIESVEQFGEVKCVKYAAPSTDELAVSIEPYLSGSRGLLLEFHGALTWSSRGLMEAYMKMESLEFYARVLYQKRLLGNENRLEEGRVRELLWIKEKLGIE